MIQTPRNVHALCNATHHWCKTRRLSEKITWLPRNADQIFLNRRKERPNAQKYIALSRHTRKILQVPPLPTLSNLACTCTRRALTSSDVTRPDQGKGQNRLLWKQKLKKLRVYIYLTILNCLAIKSHRGAVQI